MKACSHACEECLAESDAAARYVRKILKISATEYSHGPLTDKACELIRNRPSGMENKMQIAGWVVKQMLATKK